jgi:hypothetical protein
VLELQASAWESEDREELYVVAAKFARNAFFRPSVDYYDEMKQAVKFLNLMFM